MDPHESGNRNLEANLEGANLSHARLEGAGLKDVNLEGKDLSNANLTSADLFSANLQGGHIWAANGLTQEQIDRVIGDENTVLPRNLHAS
jgi:uncharacterized protein YjbI with pentapeptide repeats